MKCILTGRIDLLALDLGRVDLGRVDREKFDLADY